MSAPEPFARMTARDMTARDARSLASESRIEAAIVAAINASGKAFAVAIANDGRRGPTEGPAAGFPDLLVLLGDGRTGYIAVKRATGRLDPARERWRETLEREGYDYALCRSADDALAALAAWGPGRVAREGLP